MNYRLSIKVIQKRVLRYQERYSTVRKTTDHSMTTILTQSTGQQSSSTAGGCCQASSTEL